jgi:hypothetical protein
MIMMMVVMMMMMVVMMIMMMVVMMIMMMFSNFSRKPCLYEITWKKYGTDRQTDHR